VLVPKKYRKNGDSESKECIVGYAKNSKGEHLIILRSQLQSLLKKT
jgi:hypothetical protein